MHRKAEGALEGGRHIGRWKTHWKAEDALETEAESETNFSQPGIHTSLDFLWHYGDESLTSLAVYFRNWHMFREYMNNIPC